MTDHKFKGLVGVSAITGKDGDWITLELLFQTGMRDVSKVRLGLVARERWASWLWWRKKNAA